MTGILSKNLSYINAYNPVLCQRILNVKEFSKDFQVTQTPSGEYNLLINGNAVHSMDGAEAEAYNIFRTLPHNSKNSIHVIYGLGLGYLCDVFAGKTEGAVIIYEHDIELLRYVLEIVDLSASFAKKRTFIVTNFAEYKAVFDNIFRYKTRTSLSVLDYYQVHEKTLFELFSSEVHKTYGLVSHNYSFQVNQLYDFYTHVLDGFESKVKSKLLYDFKDALKNKPAIITSAGPSLAKNINVLKKYKDNAIIFCVGTALKTLLKNGITPDFLNIIEKTNTNIHYNVPATKDIMLVGEVFAHGDVFKRKYLRSFITASEETGAARWFLEKINKPLEKFETKGTVAYHALFTAKYLGCNPIILIGQDLAYTDGKCYAKGSEFEDLECVFDEKLQKYKILPSDYEKFRDAYYHSGNHSIELKNAMIEQTLQKFNKELVTVDGQNGNKLPTSAVYSLFIEYLQDFSARYGSELKLVNSSLGGAMIKGYELLPMDEAIAKYAQNYLNKEQLFSVFEKSITNDITFTVNSLNNDKNYLKSLLADFEKGISLVEKLNKELNRYKFYSENAQKLLDKLSDLYVIITNKHSNTSNLFGMISLKERCEIDFLMKEFNGNMDHKTAQVFAKAFNEYFSNIKSKLLYVIDKIENITEKELIANESSNSKS